MKQYITVEQLNELTEEQKERLKKWWRPNGPGLVYCEVCKSVHPLQEGQIYHQCLSPKHPECPECQKTREVEATYATKLFGMAYNPQRIQANCSHNRDNCTSPLLSIGQCIELLQEFGIHPENGPHGPFIIDILCWKTMGALVGLSWDHYDPPNGNYKDCNELINGLWEAAKAVL